MKFPNKVISYRASIISKFPLVLKELEVQDYSINDLYVKLEKKVENLSEYIDILVCLYYLGMIDLLPGGVKLHYVKRDSMRKICK